MRTNRQDAPYKEAELIQVCAAAIRRVLGDVTVEHEPAKEARHRDTRRDAGKITIRGSWGTLTFMLEAKRRITAAIVKPLIAQIERRSRPLLMTEYIDPQTANLLRERNINFADAAGNMFLDAPRLFVYQRGYKREAPATRPRRLLQVVGLKILSVLLWEPDAVNLTYRVLAHRVGISLGAIVPVFDDLGKVGFLIATGGRRQLTRQRELLEQWVLGYAGQLFPHLIRKTCRLAGSQTVETLATTLRQHPHRDEVLVGGELAAGFATGYLRPARAALHLPPGSLAKWMGALRLVPDPEGQVDIIERFSSGNQWNDPPAEFQGLACANPVLIYGELLRLGTDERLRETADLLLQKFIIPRFGAGP